MDRSRDRQATMPLYVQEEGVRARTRRPASTSGDQRVHVTGVDDPLPQRPPASNHSCHPVRARRRRSCRLTAHTREAAAVSRPSARGCRQAAGVSRKARSAPGTQHVPTTLGASRHTSANGGRHPANHNSRPQSTYTIRQVTSNRRVPPVAPTSRDLDPQVPIGTAHSAGAARNRHAGTATRQPTCGA